MPLCNYCGQPVWGNYISALGTTWHPEHFLCAGCGQPLRDAEFEIASGKPYHITCYQAYVAPRCAYCGQPISGSYNVVDGKSYHTACFHDHVVPRCAYCDQPLTDVYKVLDGKSYHAACFRDHVAPRCIYCHKPLLDTYLIDPWGDKYCQEHERQYPRCSFCGRLISPQQQTPGWDAYGSSRCSVCRSTAIDAIEQGQPLFQQCKQWIGQQGFRFNQLPLRLNLWDRATLVSKLQDRGINHPLGITLSSRQAQGGYLIGSSIEGVAVLQGMPATLFAGVVLHELGHVWLTVQGVESLPLWAEEGFCQLLSYRYYSDLNTPEARYYARGLEQERDPIYGDGFRSVRAISEKLSFPRLVETLQTTKRLPGNAR